jgi:hypothetical protein
MDLTSPVPFASPHDEADEVELVDWGDDDNMGKDEVLVVGLDVPPNEAPSAPASYTLGSSGSLVQGGLACAARASSSREPIIPLALKPQPWLIPGAPSCQPMELCGTADSGLRRTIQVAPSRAPAPARLKSIIVWATTVLMSSVRVDSHHRTMWSRLKFIEDCVAGLPE